jgi:hypothetical protein
MIDAEFEVCFELLLSVVPSKRRPKRVPERVTISEGAQKQKAQFIPHFPCSTTLYGCLQIWMDA